MTEQQMLHDFVTGVIEEAKKRDLKGDFISEEQLLGDLDGLLHESVTYTFAILDRWKFCILANNGEPDNLVMELFKYSYRFGRFGLLVADLDEFMIQDISKQPWGSYSPEALFDTLIGVDK